MLNNILMGPYEICASVMFLQVNLNIRYTLLYCDVLIMQTCLSNIYDHCLCFPHVLNNCLINCADLTVL